MLGKIKKEGNIECQGTGDRIRGVMRKGDPRVTAEPQAQGVTIQTGAAQEPPDKPWPRRET